MEDIYRLASVFISEHNNAGLWNPFSADEQASIKLFASWLESRLTPVGVDAAINLHSGKQAIPAAQLNYGR